MPQATQQKYDIDEVPTEVESSESDRPPESSSFQLLLRKDKKRKRQQSGRVSFGDMSLRKRFRGRVSNFLSCTLVTTVQQHLGR